MRLGCRLRMAAAIPVRVTNRMPWPAAMARWVAPTRQSAATTANATSPSSPPQRAPRSGRDTVTRCGCGSGMGGGYHRRLAASSVAKGNCRSGDEGGQVLPSGNPLQWCQLRRREVAYVDVSRVLWSRSARGARFHVPAHVLPGNPPMPSRTRLAAAAMGATAAAVPAGVIASTYVVHPGDTLSAIALRHGTTVRALAEANQLADPNLIRIGQLLQIPDSKMGTPGYTARGADSESYIVVHGDALISIARRYGLDLTALARSNGLNVNAPLHVGAVLHLPGRIARVNALLVHVANQIGVDPKLVKAVAWMESGWHQGVVSPTGAIGLMQVEPYTGEWVSRYLAGRTLNLRVASDNATAGTLLLHHLLSVHSCDVHAALAAYYQGDASIGRHGLYDDTRRYQKVVTDLIKSE
ncbi:MAG: hypothetical protein DLM65_05875 [Candidatus Aeolococcus gillhamiae]|uniref:LysM domain-containing protein n=2 Tax=Candidatus Aeolococcus gillhamiae TaxID=3127015 RepID=A0A2W5Z7Q6_9BACT|nr:MAG: hypothetical protein DLM65_05875 [Candidatus Dormibacter sp. RRmetagenome_bin12]